MLDEGSDDGSDDGCDVSRTQVPPFLSQLLHNVHSEMPSPAHDEHVVTSRQLPWELTQLLHAEHSGLLSPVHDEHVLCSRRRMCVIAAGVLFSEH